jgi:hypothetical protein
MWLVVSVAQTESFQKRQIAVENYEYNPVRIMVVCSSPLKLWYRKLNSVAVVRKRTIPTERPPLDGEVSATFADRGCCVVIATNSHSR